jgi:hypothetical protein
MANTTYEWDIESVDEHGDIQGHHFFDKCPGIPADDYDDDGLTPALVLVRDTWDEGGLTDRYWAYVADGKLPEYFLDAYNNEGPRVPKRFHAELRRATT